MSAATTTTASCLRAASRPYARALAAPSSRGRAYSSQPQPQPGPKSTPATPSHTPASAAPSSAPSTASASMSASTSASPPSPPRQCIFSGIQPTGVPHIGNLLGALFNWVHLQDSSPRASTDLYFSIVGLHALTMPQDPARLSRERSDMLAALLAVGLDPERSTIFHQDEVHEHAELHWLLGCSVGMGRLKRMTTWKGKLASASGQSEVVGGARARAQADDVADTADTDTDTDTDLNLGLFSYPVLQAADILLYRATHVPVGEDQIQHLELARDIAASFNRRYPRAYTGGQSHPPSESSLARARTRAPPRTPAFPLPTPLITPSPRILSLRDPSSKMSKSAPDERSRILLTDSDADIAGKIRSAVTDSDRAITFDPTARRGVANLLSICAALETWRGRAGGRAGDTRAVAAAAAVSPEDVAQRLQSQSESESGSESGTAGSALLKAHTTALAIDVLAPIRERFLALRTRRDFLQDVAHLGRDKAQRRAREVLREVKGRVGLGASA